MWPGVAIDGHVMPVQELFSSSVLHRYDIGMAAPPSMQGVQYFVWAVLFLIFFALVFRNQTGIILAWAWDFFRLPSKRTYSESSSAVRYGLPLSVLIFIPVAAYLVYGSLAVNTSYPLILAVIAGYMVLRLLLLAGIAYVSREGELVIALVRAGFLAFIGISFIYCILFIIGMFIPDLQPLLAGHAALAVAAAFMLIYVAELSRIFFAFREPVLLTILYLCTLEILPVAAATVIVLRY